MGSRDLGKKRWQILFIVGGVPGRRMSDIHHGVAGATKGVARTSWIFRIIAAAVSGQRERKIVGVSVNKIPSVADVARPSALRTAVVSRAVRHRSIVPRAVVVASSARRDGKTSAGQEDRSLGS